MATAEMAFGGGLNSSSSGELKLYLCCTGSMQGDPLARRPSGKETPQQEDPPAGRPPQARRPSWQGDPPGKETPPVNVRAVRILLECILV